MKTVYRYGIIIGVVVVLAALTGVYFYVKNRAEEPGESFETNADFNQNRAEETNEAKIIFLHHSIGQNIWDGGVEKWFSSYNEQNDKNYQITQQDFPKDAPYGWENYPYDYWNIWVSHAGEEKYLDEPTLEILTDKYDIIVFKHCFPVSDIEADAGNPDISSSEKTAENYKLQYNALKEKMNEFLETKFIVWTGAAQVAGATSPDFANRAKGFFNWVKNDWDIEGDNIFIFDFYELETEGGLYLKGEYAESSDDSHPNESFAKTVAPKFSTRIVEVTRGRGDSSSLTGD